MSAIFRSQEVDFVFGDYKATVSNYAKEPDIACMNLHGSLRFVGEIKTPWVNDHVLEDAEKETPHLRLILG
jgi:hypothetical protein